MSPVDRTVFWPYREDAEASMFSARFAEDVIAPLKPRRVLEVGCGVGRTLAQVVRVVDSVEVAGVEPYPDAVKQAQEAIGASGTVLPGSLYDLPDLGHFDVAYTVGVLMHVPHEDIEKVIGAMLDRATVVAHYELHGQANDFDFHRYPRHYGRLYEELGVPASYKVRKRRDPMGLLVSRSR